MSIQPTGLNGRVFVVTGANTGIGLITAEALANGGARVVMANRSLERTQPALDQIRSRHGDDAATFVPLDLTSLASVRACAQTILETEPRIDVLINNAGIAGTTGETADGFELAFGINHLGHFLLTHLLLDRITETGTDARIVNVSSRAHYRATSLDLDQVRGPSRTKTGLAEYQESKLANVLFTASLAKRLEGTGVRTYALHPGVVATEIWRSLPGPIAWIAKRFMISPEEGAQTTLYCATSDACAAESGLYYDTCRARTPSALARDTSLAEALWERSVAWCDLDATS